MKISEFFISRPVFATILNALIIIVGLLFYKALPLREYPKVSIPVMNISVQYPNASAELVETEVASPLEEGLAGIEGLESISSSAQFGNCNVTLMFKAGTNSETATARVRDKLAGVKPRLPKDAKEPIIQAEGADSQQFFWISVSAPQFSFAELTHFADLYIKNPLRSIQGVSSVQVIGQEYVMRVSLDRLKMFSHGIGIDEVVETLEKNKISLPAGKFKGEIPLNLELGLTTPEDFENLVIRKVKDSVVLLKDIALVKLSFDDKFRVGVNGEGGVLIGIVKSSDGNQLEVSDAVKKLLPDLQKQLPEGVTLTTLADFTDFIRTSLDGIKHAIFEAIVLVFLIIFVFLRTIRASLIPLITIPISLIGTFIFMGIFGLSVNTLTLLAMVLAVGLVVDDAIVVLENIHRHLEAGLSPLEAAKKGSREIGFAIIAMTITLASVYAPIAFIQGVVGQLFAEFAMTLAGAVVVSGIVALTLSPMMCSKILKPKSREFFPKLQTYFTKLDDLYSNSLGMVLRFPKTVLLSSVGVIGLSIILFKVLPSEIVPPEDHGVFGAMVQPIAGKSVETFGQYMQKVEALASAIPEKSMTLAFVGGSWGGNVVVKLKDRSDRKRSTEELFKEFEEKAKDTPSVDVWPWNYTASLPGIEGGGGGGMTLSFAAQTTGSYEDLSRMLDKFAASCRKDGFFAEVYHDLKLNYPGITAKIDTKNMTLLGLTPQEIAKALEVMLHEAQPIEFNKDGLKYNVLLEAAHSPDDLNELYVTNAQGKQISLASVVKLEASTVPKALPHYNQLRSGTFNAMLKPDQSFGDGVAYLNKKIASDLPANLKVEYVGAIKQYEDSSNAMILLFVTALIFIYCILAIQFESFSDPLIIMVTVPLALGGALLMLWIAGQSLNIYSQVGLVTLIGLITKHGILIVEFANRQLAEGKKSLEAVRTAASLRFRPILMTTGAMIFGSLPLILSTGDGSEPRHAIGFVLLGGLLFGTALTLFVIPTAYLMVKGRQ